MCLCTVSKSLCCLKIILSFFNSKPQFNVLSVYMEKIFDFASSDAPFLTSGPPQVFYEEQDGNVTLNCDAEGHPPPNFRWVYNGVNMTEETDSLFVNQVSSNSIYTCTATNALGRITKEFHFKVTKISTTTPAEAMAMPEESLPKGTKYE